MAYTQEQMEHANFFAKALLMPEKLYREQVERNTEPDGTVHTDKIAAYFGVPVSLAADRGYDLGVLQKPAWR